MTMDLIEEPSVKYCNEDLAENSILKYIYGNMTDKI